MIHFYCPELIPDHFHLSGIKPSEYFGLITGSTTSIFGILVAVVLLTFEFTKHASFKLDDENIFNKAQVTNFVYLAVSIIVLSFISFTSISSFSNHFDLTIGYFLGFLFIIFIFAIFPVSKSILDTANTLKKTREEINNLILEDFEMIQSIKTSKFISKDNSVKLVKIRSELVKVVRDSDYEGYNTILSDLNKSVLKIIKNGDNRLTTLSVFQGLTFIWKSGNLEAFRLGNHQFYDTIWECIEELYEYAAKKKIFLLHFEEIDYFINDFINFLSRKKLGDSLNTGFKTLNKSFIQNLKYNCPPQEEIKFLYLIYERKPQLKHSPENNIHWDKIVDLFNKSNRIQNASITIGDEELFSSCQFENSYLAKQIFYQEQIILEPYKEAYLITHIISYQFYYALKAIQSTKLENPLLFVHSYSSLLSDATQANKIYLPRLLEDYSDFLITSQRLKKLDDYYLLNDLGALGRHLSEFYCSNTLAQKTINYTLDIFEHLKNEIEKDQLPEQSKNYIALKDQLKSIKDWLLKDNPTQEILVINRIDKIFNSFLDVEVRRNTSIIPFNTKE